MYPRANPVPEMQISPAIPGGQRLLHSSITKTFILLFGTPISEISLGSLPSKIKVVVIGHASDGP